MTIWLKVPKARNSRLKDDWQRRVATEILSYSWDQILGSPFSCLHRHVPPRKANEIWSYSWGKILGSPFSCLHRHVPPRIAFPPRFTEPRCVYFTVYSQRFCHKVTAIDLFMEPSYWQALGIVTGYPAQAEMSSHTGDTIKYKPLFTLLSSNTCI